jgi:hypothetical protein
MHINLHDDDQWNWNIIATRSKQNFMVTKAIGKKGQTGVVGIPNIEKCTLTCVHTGFIEILDENLEVLGTMGPGAKFHYGILEQGLSFMKPELGRVDYLGKPIPPPEVCKRVASYTHVLLRTASEESIFYCCHDPKDMFIWEGDNYAFGNFSGFDTRFDLELDSEFVIEPKMGTFFFGYDDNIIINGKKVPKYNKINSYIYDEPMSIRGPEGSSFSIFSQEGMYKETSGNRRYQI